MQKLTGTSSCKNNKSCGIFHNESTKLVLLFLIFLRFSTQFTRIRKITSLFELPICRKAPGKKFCFAMWPLGRPGGAGGANFGELVAGLAGEGRGKGLGLLGAGLRAWLGRGVAGRAGTPAAKGGGRRGCRFPARGGSVEGKVSQRVVARAREGGGRVRLACGRPELELAAAAQGRRRTARCGGEGRCASRPGAVAPF
jgi:hypothetical protein